MNNNLFAPGRKPIDEHDEGATFSPRKEDKGAQDLHRLPS
jgi:hypothetical protein